MLDYLQIHVAIQNKFLCLTGTIPLLFPPSPPPTKVISRDRHTHKLTLRKKKASWSVWELNLKLVIQSHVQNEETRVSRNSIWYRNHGVKIYYILQTLGQGQPAGSNLFRKNVPHQQSTAAMYECTSTLMHVNDPPACIHAFYYRPYYFPPGREQTRLEKVPLSTTDEQLPACHRLQHPRRAATNFNNCATPEPRCRWRRYLCRKTCEQHCHSPVRNLHKCRTANQIGQILLPYRSQCSRFRPPSSRRRCLERDWDLNLRRRNLRRRLRSWLPVMENGSWQDAVKPPHWWWMPQQQTHPTN